MKGQISAEMLIILVILIGVALIVASQLIKTATQAGKEIEKKTGQIFEISKSCETDLDCDAGESCINNVCSGISG
ncbi:MAG: hypothetical protein QXW70_03005 [Candidatus Anstonellales archaeon]